jgi:hypothetical protein
MSIFECSFLACICTFIEAVLFYIFFVYPMYFEGSCTNLIPLIFRVFHACYQCINSSNREIETKNRASNKHTVTLKSEITVTEVKNACIQDSAEYQWNNEHKSNCAVSDSRISNSGGQASGRYREGCHGILTCAPINRAEASIMNWVESNLLAPEHKGAEWRREFGRAEWRQVSSGA